MIDRRRCCHHCCSWWSASLRKCQVPTRSFILSSNFCCEFSIHFYALPLLPYCFKFLKMMIHTSLFPFLTFSSECHVIFHPLTVSTRLIFLSSFFPPNYVNKRKGQLVAHSLRLLMILFSVYMEIIVLELSSLRLILLLVLSASRNNQYSSGENEDWQYFSMVLFYCGDTIEVSVAFSRCALCVHYLSVFGKERNTSCRSCVKPGQAEVPPLIFRVVDHT